MEAELTLEDAYRKWADDLVRYATVVTGPSDAADVVADAFAGLLARGDAAWATVREPRPYLFRAVLNTARMRERGRSRREQREWRLHDRPLAGDLNGDPEVQRAVSALSTRQRAVIYLTYWEDLRPGEVAAVLGVSEGAVRRQLARARAGLRKVLS